MKTKLVTFLALLTGIWFIQDILRGYSETISGGWQENVLLLSIMALGLLGMLLSLRWQGFGGIVALAASIPIAVLVYLHSQANPLGYALLIGSPYFIAGGLSLLAWRQKRRTRAEATPMALEMLHMLLRREGKTEEEIDAIQRESFGVSLRELVKSGAYRPQLEMSSEEDGWKENLIDLMDTPSERYKTLTHDEARMLHIPARRKEEAIQSLRAVKTQPHIPYRQFQQYVCNSPAGKRYSNNLKIRLRRALSQEQAGAFASLCLDCETVIGMHEAPIGTDPLEFSTVLTIVGAENGWTCPLCGSSRWAFLKSGALNTGYTLDRLVPQDLRQMGY